MSNIYRYAPHIRHFQLPQTMVEKIPYLTLLDYRMLCYLNSEHQRTSRSDLTFTGEAISIATGIHPTDIGATRDSLVKCGLLLVNKVGRTHHYILCDPGDRTPVPDGRSTGVGIDFDALTADELQRYFKPLLKKCKLTDNGLSGCCPFPTHQDERPSFRVELKDGSGGLWTCDGCGKSGKIVDFEINLADDGSGCLIERTEAHRRATTRLHALGVKESTTGPQDVIYSYCDEDGEINSETVRPGGDKNKMYRRRPNPDYPDRYIRNTKGCKTLLYKLPDVMEADTVLITEGEPDVHRLLSLNLMDTTCKFIAVTTNANGAGKWRKEHTDQIKGKCVILIGDNDEDGKGLRHMESVKAAIKDVVKDLTHVILPSEFKDVSNYLETHTATDLIEMVGGDWLELPTPI